MQAKIDLMVSSFQHFHTDANVVWLTDLATSDSWLSTLPVNVRPPLMRLQLLFTMARSWCPNLCHHLTATSATPVQVAISRVIETVDHSKPRTLLHAKLTAQIKYMMLIRNLPKEQQPQWVIFSATSAFYTKPLDILEHSEDRDLLQVYRPNE